MKNRYLKNFNSMLNTPSFKLFMIVMTLMSLFCSALTTYKMDYFTSVIRIYTYSFYFVVLIAMMILITHKTVEMFKENQFQLIRMKSKEKCFETIMCQVVLNFSICFIVTVLLVFIGANLFHADNIIIQDIGPGISNVLYIFFLIFKAYLYLLILMLINTLLFYIIDEKLIIFLNALMVFTIEGYYLYLPYIKYEGNEIPIFISGLFTDTKFASFESELCITIGYFLIILLICYSLFKYVINKSKSMI